MISSVTISNDAAKRLAKGEVWFGIRDVTGRKPSVASIARVLDRKGAIIGMAFLSPGSRYYLRVFSKKEEFPDREFWRKRVRLAFERRAPLAKISDAYRVVHAEADGIPSVVMDRYNDVWAIQITSAGAETIKEELVDIIREDYNPRAIVEKPRDDTSWLSFRHALSRNPGGALGFRPPPRRNDKLGSQDDNLVTVIREGDQKFEIDVLCGQKTGAYLDYRAFRLKAREFARGRCLDAFCYQGWFACQIGAHAEHVVAVDSSAAAIVAAKRNALLNGHDNIDFVKADVFDYLAHAREQFDFIHLDPPSFAKGRGGVRSAIAGYCKLMGLALKLLKSGGVILVSSCSHNITERILEETVTDCLKKHRANFKVVYRGIQDRDHPVMRGHAESLYLKAVGFTCSGG